MLNSTSEELKIVKDLFNKGKFGDALQLIKDIEQIENLTHEEMLKTLYYKGRIYFNLGQSDASFEIAEQLYQKSQEMKLPLFSLDAFALKAIVLYGYGVPGEEFYSTLNQYENLFNSLPREESLEFQERKAHLMVWKGARDYNKGDFNLALDYFNKSLELINRVDPHASVILLILMGMASAFRLKGELNQALEYTKKAISLLPENGDSNVRPIRRSLYSLFGVIYLQQGDLDNALDYSLKLLEFEKKFKSIMGVKYAYLHIILVLHAKNNFKQAQSYFEESKQFVEKPETDVYYQAAHALVLKTSPRLRDHFEATTILKKLIEEFHQAPSIILNILIHHYLLVSLCDLYIEEFRLSNQMEVLDEIPPLIDLLQKNAKLQNSYTSLAYVKFLQAKLALLQVNMVGARNLLTEAQKIADEHGLQRLAGAISNEHDHLLKELKLWESLKKTQSSVSERLKLASIDGILERMQGKRAIELPEFDLEEPILLLIMDKSGVTYFNYSFIENWDFSDLFSSFMSAFNAFSGEIFSRSIDRIKIGENTILINPIEPFLACYVIKGQSYPAQQKLTRFSDSVKASPEIWEALNRAAKTSEILELDNPPSLGSTVNEIFAF